MNHEIIRSLTTGFPYQESWLSQYGDVLIEELFDNVPTNTPLKTREIWQLMPTLTARYTARSAKDHLMALLRYLEAEGRITGEPQVLRVKKGYWQF